LELLEESGDLSPKEYVYRTNIQVELYNLRREPIGIKALMGDGYWKMIKILLISIGLQ
jgi:hypothetical protein